VRADIMDEEVIEALHQGGNLCDLRCHRDRHRPASAPDREEPRDQTSEAGHRLVR
jgi:hypothetical protein